MKCLYCQQESKEITSPFTTDENKIWQCLNCPFEVRFMEEMINIFVFHHNEEYCLSWRRLDKIFRVICIRKGSSPICCEIPVGDNFFPNVINPSNAAQKLLTFLTFS
jgi:hypothetical protein